MHRTGNSPGASWPGSLPQIASTPGIQVDWSAMEELRGRLVAAFAAVLFVLIIGTSGYYLMGSARWGVFDCFYMTIITLTTVGYGEVLPGISEVAHARAFTVLLLVLGMGTMVYFASTLTALIIEGDLRRAL